MGVQGISVIVGRRWVLTRFGRGAVAVAVLGVAGCGDDGGEDAAPSEASPGEGTTGMDTPTESPSPQPLAWERVDLGFVAAYVLVRGQEAAVVDTGVEGSADAIEAVLDQAGPGWSGVRHVLLTHRHPDHVGSLGEVMTRAGGATGYVGEGDLAAVEGLAAVQPVTDGQEVFGLQVVATPGHTAGHVAVFDADAGVLVAGDAVTNSDGLTGSPPEFTEDPAQAAESVRKLADLAPDTILPGHGPPVTEGAAQALRDLAASLA